MCIGMPNAMGRNANNARRWFGACRALTSLCYPWIKKNDGAVISIFYYERVILILSYSSGL